MVSRQAARLELEALEPRRRAVLEAAVEIFTRFGYRKTSMEDVARAAGLSRQGLYLHYATKEELFRAGLVYALETTASAATAALGEKEASLETRLGRGLDAWLGPYVGILTGEAGDVFEAAEAQEGALLRDCEARFESAVERAIRAATDPARLKQAGVSARQVARTVIAAATGVKHTAKKREAFVEEVRAVVRVVCAFLEEKR